MSRFAAAAYRAVESALEAGRSRDALQSLSGELLGEARFRVLFDRGPLAIYSCDAWGTIQEFNASAVALWGCAPEQENPDDRYCGSHKAFLLDGTPLPHDRTPVVDVLSGKLPAVQDAEVILERPDGSHLTVVVNIVPLKNDRGEITGAMNCFYDVTERKRDAEALRASEAFNRSIIESSPDCIKVLDLDGNLLSMESGQELLGIEDISPYLNKSWIEFWDGDDRRAAQAALDKARAGGEGHFAGFFRTLLGVPKWWDVAISPLRDADGQIARLLSVSRDITDRKRAETLVADQKNVLELAAGGAPLMEILQLVVDAARRHAGEESRASMFVLEPDGAHLRFVVGAGLDEAYTRAVDQFAVGPESPSCGGAAFTGCLVIVGDVEADPLWVPFLSVVRAHDMRAIWSQPLRTVGGKVLGTMALYHRVPRVPGPGELDAVKILSQTAALVIERAREAEQRLLSDAALRASETRFRGMIDALPAAVYTTDADGVLTHFNPAAAEASGRTPVLGTDRWCVSWKMYRPDGTPLPHDECPMAVSLKEGRAIRGEEIILERPDGTRRWVEPYPTPLRDADGKIVAGINMVVDITERKRTEAQLRLNHDTFFDLIKNARFGVYVIDAQFRVRQVSIAAQKAFANVHPLIGRDFAEVMRTLWSEPLAADAIAHYRHTLATGEAYDAPNFTERRADIDAVESYDWSIERVTLPDGQHGVICYFYDITDIKQAQESLRESEERYRTLFDSMDEGYCIIEMIFGTHGEPDDYRFLEVNGAFEKQSGVRGATGKRMRELAPDHEAYWFETYAAVARTGEPIRFVQHGKELNDGWFDLYAFRVGGEDSRKVAVVFSNITARKRAEQHAELLAGLSRDLATATREADIVAIAVDAVGRHLDSHRCYFVECMEDENRLIVSHNYVRDAAPSIAGELSLFDFGGTEWWRHFSSGDLIVEDVTTDPLTHANSDNYLAVGVPSYAVQPFRREGPWTVCLVVTEASPRKWTAYDLRVLEDVVARVWPMVERARADRSLRESEGRYRHLFDAIDEGFCVIDMIYDDDGRPVDYCFAEVNPAFEAQSGLVGAIGNCVSELVPGLEPHWYETYGEVARTGEPMRLAVEVKSMNRWLDIYACRVDGPGSGKVAVLFNDISERIRAEQKLHEQTEALADLHRRKDEFLAMLSHELRSPLAPISNAIQLLGLDADEGPVQKHARNVIERQVGQLTRLVDDLMEVSRITSGRVHLRKERVAIAGIVERAVETAFPMIEHRRHKLAVSVPPEPIWLDADAGRLEQVVVNLLTNAAKYTEVGGSIWLTVERGSPQECVLRVRDTGVGIAPGLLPRIFDLFTQAERSLARSQGGLGIGLALVQRLVEMHGGTVEVLSTLGQGSEFIARLPVVTTALPQKAPPPKVAAVASRPSLRMLVVDDNEDSADSLAMLLEASGQTVRTAYDGLNALETLLDYSPEVVLLDIGLPGIDGYEVAKRIRMQPAHQGAVLVALTGYGQESDRQLSRDAGFDHHLVKPADFAQLERILAGVARRSS